MPRLTLWYIGITTYSTWEKSLRKTRLRLSKLNQRMRDVKNLHLDPHCKYSSPKHLFSMHMTLRMHFIKRSKKKHFRPNCHNSFLQLPIAKASFNKDYWARDKLWIAAWLQTVALTKRSSRLISVRPQPWAAPICCPRASWTCAQDQTMWHLEMKHNASV
jgi:hypothetical protein